MKITKLYGKIKGTVSQVAIMKETLPLLRFNRSRTNDISVITPVCLADDYESPINVNAYRLVQQIRHYSILKEDR